MAGWGSRGGSPARRPLGSAHCPLRWPAPLRRRLAGVTIGAGTAGLGYAVLAAAAPPHWRRRNYRGAQVTLAAGPALLAGTLAGAAVACPAGGARVLSALLTAVVPAAVAGGYDDAYGSPTVRGLQGHFDALHHGTVTTGLGKVVAISTGAVLAAYQLGGSAYDLLLSAGLIAGTANLLNLLDVRPGRAAKAGAALGAALTARPGGWPAAGALGAATALLPIDLAERGMLGDAGANALGAALGVALAAQGGRGTRGASLLGVAALNLASERVSFTAVIEATPLLRWLDRLGRAP